MKIWFFRQLFEAGSFIRLHFSFFSSSDGGNPGPGPSGEQRRVCPQPVRVSVHVYPVRLPRPHFRPVGAITRHPCSRRAAGVHAHCHPAGTDNQILFDVR